MNSQTTKKHRIDPGHYFTCERSNAGRYMYEVYRGDDKLARRLFSTECKARSLADVEAHAREALRMYIVKHDACSVATVANLTRIDELIATHPLLDDDSRMVARVLRKAEGAAGFSMLRFARSGLLSAGRDYGEVCESDDDGEDAKTASLKLCHAAALYIYEALRVQTERIGTGAATAMRTIEILMMEPLP